MRHDSENGRLATWDLNYEKTIARSAHHAVSGVKPAMLGRHERRAGVAAAEQVDGDDLSG